MTRVLLLAYHFPPRGGAGVQRAVSLARHLPRPGLELTVVSGPAAPRAGGPVDTSLAARLAPGVEIVRVADDEPAEAGTWRGRCERWLRTPDAWSGWWTAGALEASRQVGPVDVVVATMSPFQSARAAASIAAERGVPWIADLRDPWALDEMQVYETAVHRRLDLARMRRELASAEVVVMNTPEAAAALRRVFPELGTRVVTIPNGFDVGDFASLPVATDDGPFRIVHAGQVHVGLGRSERRLRVLRRLTGGAIGRVDIFSRSHVFLVAAVERLLRARPELRGEVEIHLVGGFSAADAAAVRSEAVRSHGYLDHDSCLRILAGADLLFLPMHDLAPGTRSRIVPGKTYEYLASGRPILAAVPDGDARDLLEEAESAVLVRPKDVAAMASAVEREVDAVRRQGRRPSRVPAFLGGYERRSLAERFARVISESVEPGRAAEPSRGEASLRAVPVRSGATAETGIR